MWRRWFSVSLLLLAVMIAAITWRQQQTSPVRNVIILTIESTRAALISPDITPNLWQAATQSGQKFTRHRAISAWTAPNAIAILTCRSAFGQAVHGPFDRLRNLQHLPLPQLKQKGLAVNGLQAFMQIDQFQDLGLDLVPDGLELRHYLAQQVQADQPFLVWYHYLDTHLPYAPSPEFMPDWKKLLPTPDPETLARLNAVQKLPSLPAREYHFEADDVAAVQALHQGTLTEFDHWFGQFWRDFQDLGLANNTMLIVTADHGDEHGERGRVGHASTTHDAQLFDEITALPLVIWHPHKPEPKVHEQPSDHLDLMPTIMNWLETPMAVPCAEGQDLFDAQRKSRFWQALTSKAGFGEKNPDGIVEFVAARIEGSYKLILEIRDNNIIKRQLFNLATDPRELNDLSVHLPDLTAQMEQRLFSNFQLRQMPQQATSGAAFGEKVMWLNPNQSQSVGYDDLEGGIHLAWSGPDDLEYVIEYRAGIPGTGPQLEGAIHVKGNQKKIDLPSRFFWDKFILPYQQVEIRVGPTGQQQWKSDWLRIEAKK